MTEEEQIQQAIDCLNEDDSHVHHHKYSFPIIKEKLPLWDMYPFQLVELEKVNGKWQLSPA